MSGELEVFEVDQQEEPVALVLPITGEVISLDKPAQVADALRQVRELKQTFDRVRDVLERALVAESQRMGTKTMRFGSLTAEVKADSGVEWDVTELVKLLDAGLPAERYADLVTETVDYKVSSSVARQIEGSGNEEYARIIGLARRRVPKKPYVSVR